jgi:hypothetical protein
MNDADTLDALLAFVKDEDRVCPRPMEWQDFWESLPDARRTDDGWQPAPPLVLSAWWSTTDHAKSDRLREHIEWAADHGAIEAADRFLRALPLEAWHHSNPAKPSY